MELLNLELWDSIPHLLQQVQSFDATCLLINLTIGQITELCAPAAAFPSHVLTEVTDTRINAGQLAKRMDNWHSPSLTFFLKIKYHFSDFLSRDYVIVIYSLFRLPLSFCNCIFPVAILFSGLIFSFFFL